MLPCRNEPHRVRAPDASAFAYGELLSSRTSHDEVADDPEYECEYYRTGQGGHREHLAFGRLEAVPSIPNQMADAAQHVVDQCPGVTEKDELADCAPQEPLKVCISVRSARSCDQPPGKQQHSEIKRGTGDAVNDGHHHRQHRLVDLQMRR